MEKCGSGTEKSGSAAKFGFPNIKYKSKRLY
jgi:hypothetical protein